MDVGLHGREDPEMDTIHEPAGSAIRITACPELCFVFQEIHSTALKPQMSWCSLLQRLLRVTLILTLYISALQRWQRESMKVKAHILTSLGSGKGYCSMMLVFRGGERAELRAGYSFSISYTSHISLCLKEVNKIMLTGK